MKESKPEYRYKYYKDLKALLLAITTALGVAFVGFISNLTMPENKKLAVSALILALISVVLNLVSTFLDYIGSGSLWDANAARKIQDRSWQAHYENARYFGLVSGIFVITQIVLTISWLVLMVIFVIKNI